MVTAIPVVAGFAVMAAAAVGGSRLAATATGQAGQASSQQSASAAGAPYMQLWKEADKAIHIWEDEQSALSDNINGRNGYQEDCEEAEHDPDNWDYVAVNGRNLKEQAIYDTNLLKPYRDATVKLLDKLRDRWPHGSAKWGKVQHAATKITAALASYTDAMNEVRSAGASYMGRDCSGASRAFAKANKSLRDGLHKLATGMNEAKELAQEA